MKVEVQSMQPDEALLRTAPPRLPDAFVGGARLDLAQARWAGAALVEVRAPAGYGKTALLAHWRRSCLSAGEVVAWLSLDGELGAAGFVQGLAAALAAGSGRRPPKGSPEAPPAQAMTAWLARVASLGGPVTLMLDDIHRLPATVLDGPMAYLLHLMPANLRVVVAGRPARTTLGGLCDGRGYVLLNECELRLTATESAVLLRGRYGDALDDDTCARLHAMSEGWPLGLTLAAAGIDRAPGWSEAISRGEQVGRELEQYFQRILIDSLGPEMDAFLTKLAIVRDIHADLARVITGSADAAERLEVLRGATPVLSLAPVDGWYRLHVLVRTFFRQRLASLAPMQRRALHASAAQWFAQAHQYAEAAHHAREAGCEELLRSTLSQALYASVAQGSIAAVRAWDGALLDQCLRQDEQLCLTLCLTLAYSTEADLVPAWVGPIRQRSQPGSVAWRQAGASLAAVAAVRDRLDECEQLMNIPAAAPEAGAGALPDRVHASEAATQAYLALHQGRVEAARLILERVRTPAHTPGREAIQRICDHMYARTYLWEGRPREAARYARAALEECETALPRRSQHATALASVLAAALWEQGDDGDQVAMLLADRLDLFELGGPMTAVNAFVTAAQLACERGEHLRAESLLWRLAELGRMRGQPRLELTALRYHVQFQAQLGHESACSRLIREIETVAARADRSGLLAHLLELQVALARAHASLARKEWRDLQAQASIAEALAVMLGRVGDVARAKALTALALCRLGQDESATLAEAYHLVDTRGLQRLRDEMTDAFSFPVLRRAQPAQAPLMAGNSLTRIRVTPSSLLTPKEGDILLLLARGLTNKQIGLALDCSDQTVKWHLQNLYTKFAVGRRKHLVERAQMLGIIEIEG
ncbi:LuxR C-terminal-related transcriptional regulator [Microbulbifer magnicolonia]|uniref:LuxR C-terminal-related transcriptional regulator n=1 Tax=Microbulbifer magnicolonia TaxID=3109744 RepID=UPI002B4092EE|nr:LuxR C-terminal-related transcriptional regulator [Microbulbifer sp. GG15]